MPISYDKLWKLLIDKKMNRTDLKNASGISFNVLAKMGKNEFVSMESLHKICLTLKCDVGDIVEFIDEGDTEPVSYTHLDVYKRQTPKSTTPSTART